jgi:hypothetical protein
VAKDVVGKGGGLAFALYYLAMIYAISIVKNGWVVLMLCIEISLGRVGGSEKNL